MKFLLILVLVGVLALHAVSGVFWNSRSTGGRVRLRPPRHHGPPSGGPYHPPNHRAHKPMFSKQRQRAHPHHHVPVKSYRHPTSSTHGSMFLSPSPQPNHNKPHSAPAQNYDYNYKPHSGRPAPHHNSMDHGEFPLGRPEFNKHEAPISNLIDSPGFKTSSDSNQHGYLSPAYSGWKPISKPNYFLKAFGKESSGKRDYYVYPSTEAYVDQDGKHQKLALNTLFRDSVGHVKPLKSVKLKQDYSENHVVSIPFPPEVGESITLPSTFFFDKPVKSYYNSYNLAASQSEDKPVIQKPFPKFQPRPKPPPNASDSVFDVLSESSPPKDKYKISRPKLRLPIPTQYQQNEPEPEGLGHSNLPKVSLTPSHNAQPKPIIPSHPPSQHEPSRPKGKINKVRTRVRVKEQKAEGYVGTEELGQILSYREPGWVPPGPRAPTNGRTPYAHHEQSGHTSQAHAHPSNPHFGNETFDFNQAPLHPTYPTYPANPPPSPQPTDFIKGYASDKQHQRYVTQPEITENPQHRIPEGGKMRVVEKQVGHGGRNKIPKSRHRNVGPPVVYNEGPVYPEDFYMPPGFAETQSLGGHHPSPVSFMTMPNSQPQVIHHNVRPSSQNDQHLYPINVIRSPPLHKPDPTHHVPTQNGNYGQSLRPDPTHHVPSQNGNYGQSPRPDPTHQVPSQNGNYGQSPRQPFVFLNIQNGQNQGFSHGDPQAPTYPPPAYEPSVSPQPFHHSTPHYSPVPPYQQGGSYHQVTSSRPPPPDFHHFQRPESSTTGGNSYQFPSNNIRHPSNIRNNLPQHHYQTSDAYQSHQNPIFEFVGPSIGNTNLDAYASNEYEQIPIEFMNHLRPILLENDEYEGGSVPASSNQHVFHPSESINPPAGFLSSFFKPMEDSSGFQSGEQDRKTVLISQSGEGIESSGQDNYKASSNAQVRVLKPQVESPNPTSHRSVSPAPIVSVSPIQDFSLVTTGSPVQDIEFYSPKSPLPMKWSKLKVLSSTESYGSSTGKYRKPIRPTKGAERGGDEREVRPTTGLLSTLGPLLKKESVSGPEASYSNPSPLVVSGNVPAHGSSEDDSSDSNTPKTIRFQPSGSTKSDPNASAESTTSPYSRRPFRRRRPSLMARRKFFSSRVKHGEGSEAPPVTTHRPRRLVFSSPSTPTGQAEVVGTTGSEGFESSRLGLKSRRRPLGRKGDYNLSRRGLSPLGPTTPSSPDPEPVTYGEGQWFQVRESSAEADRGQEAGKSSSKDGEVSFSSRILSSPPHDVRLEPLETSSESLLEPKSSSARNFYERSSAGDGPGPQEPHVRLI